MISNGVLKLTNGTFEVYVGIQDGTEKCGGAYTNLEDAIKEFIEAQFAYNHKKYKKKEVPLFETAQEIRTIIVPLRNIK